MPQHGIKKINIRKNFKPKVGKINLQGTKFAPDNPQVVEREGEKLNQSQNEILTETKNPFLDNATN